MPFPLTHLIIAQKLSNLVAEIEKRMNFFSTEPCGWSAKSAPAPVDCLPQFLLGSIAPDAVHNRIGLDNTDRSSMGETKKATHLCHPTDELWGAITDNDAWLASILATPARTPFELGYQVHCLADLVNNQTIWGNFHKNHPQEAAKGYNSAYYDDLRHINEFLWHAHGREIREILQHSTPHGNTLVSTDEVAAIRASMLDFDIHKKDMPAHTFVSVADTYTFIDKTVEFINNVYAGQL